MNPVAGLVNLVRLIQAALRTSGRDTLNKTQIQKLTYLACSSGLRCDFEFRMHHYGPYSFDLEDTIHLLENSGILCSSVEIHQDWYEYKVGLGEDADDFLKRFGNLAPEEPMIGQVANKFGTKGTPELELAATVHLVYTLLSRDWVGKDASRSDVVETVIGLKPRFNSSQIEEAYDELIKEGLLAH